MKRLFKILAGLVLAFFAWVIWGTINNMDEQEAQAAACEELKGQQAIFQTEWNDFTPSEKRQQLALLAEGDSCGYKELHRRIELQIADRLRGMMRHPETLRHMNRYGDWGSYYMPRWEVKGDSLLLTAKHRAQSDAGLTITKYNEAIIGIQGQGTPVVGHLRIF